MTAKVVKLPKNVGKPQRWQAQCEECEPFFMQHRADKFWKGYAGRTATLAKEEAARHNTEEHQIRGCNCTSAVQ